MCVISSRAQPRHSPLDAVGPVTVTQDKEVFKAALGRVRVYGGGDCPEKSLGGIQMALDASQAGSHVYVFTDATAGDHRLVHKVLDAVQRKQSQVVFVLTGHCNDLDKPSFKVYQQIAAASSGQVFNLNKTSVHKVLDFVKSSIKGKMVNLGSSVNTAGSNTQGIPVDTSLAEVTVSVSGASPHISVVDPSGARLTGPPRLVTTLDLSEIMVVKVMQPEPGNWTITVGSEESYSVKVSGLSNLTFNHGFSTEPPRDMAETSYRPLKGAYNHMMIGLTQTEPRVTITFAEVLSMNGSTIFELPLSVVDTERQVYLAEAFIPPEGDFFYIAINGKDEYNQPLRRIGATAVQAQVPDVPYLTTSRKIRSQSHSRVVLSCKVESLVPVVAMWMRGNHKLQPQVSSLQTTSIQYVIEDLQPEHEGTYKCFARNVAGVNTALSALTMIVDPPQISVAPSNITVELGEPVTLTYTVYSEALLLDFQIIYNETKDKIELDPSIEGVYTYNKSIENASELDAGTYTCIATNKGGTVNQSATVTVQSQPSAQIIDTHTLTVPTHTLARLSCRVDNSDTVKWEQNGTVMQETAVDGATVDVLEMNVTEDVVWECVAKRKHLQAKDSVKLTVVIKPTVSIVGDKNMTVLNGSVAEVICEVTAKPRPVIVWRRRTEEVQNHAVSISNPNTYRSTLTLNTSAENVEGAYLCFGENSEGISQDQVKVIVRRKITVVSGLKDTSSELYRPVELTCLTDGLPPPQTTWYHNGTLIRSTDNVLISDDNSTVRVKRVLFEDLGIYSCDVNNGFEVVHLEGILSVHGLESPVLEKGPAKVIAVKGKSTIIPCRVMKGSPKPTITWEYKSVATDTFAILSNQSDLVISPVTDDGVYRCAGENAVGRDTRVVELEVHYPPYRQSNSSEESLQLEVGSQAALSCDAIGRPTVLVQWRKYDDLISYSNNVQTTNGHLTIHNITELDFGLYSCEATNYLGSLKMVFNISIFLAPQILSKDPGNMPLEVIEGQLVELPCEAKGAPKPVVTWRQNGDKINVERKFVDDFGIRFVANLTDFGNYSCTAKNEYGHATITYVVYVWVAPSVVPPLKVTKDILVGEDANLQCDVIGFPIPTVQWAFEQDILTKNSSEIRYNDFGNLYIKNASSKHEGTYICVAENFIGVANKYFHLYVNEMPRISDDDFEGLYLATNLDSSIAIACKATGKPKPYVIWSKDGVYLDKDSQYDISKDGTLTIKSPTEDLSGNYTCIAKSKIGQVNKTVAVEVYSLPTREQTEEAQTSTTVLERGSVTVKCPVRSSQGDTVKWYKNAELVSTGSLELLNVSRNSDATYACVVTNAVGSAYSTVSIGVEWPPSFLDDDDDKGNVHDDSDVLTKEDGINKHNKYISDDSYMKTDVNNDNLTRNESKHDINGDEKDKNANDSEDNNHRGATSLKPFTENDDIGTKTGNINNADLNTLHITKNVSKDVDIDQNLINDQRYDIISEYVGTKFNNNASKPQKEIDRRNPTVNNDEKRKGSDIMKVIEVIKGDDAYLDCQTDAKPAAKIKWLYNSKSITTASDPVLKLFNIQTHNAGTYKCVVTNKHGTVYRTFQVNVSVPPFISDFVVFDVTLMEGDNATLQCEAGGSPRPNLRWTYNNSNWKLHETTLTATNTSTHSEGIYRCDATNKAGAAHIAYRVSVVSKPRITDVIAFVNGEGVSVEKRFNAALGAHLRIACKVTGNPSPTVQWIRNGQMISENSKHVLYADLTLVVKTSDTGVYTCVAFNEHGSDDRAFRLQVLEPPKIIQNLIQNGSQTIEVLSGQSFSLHCHPIGNPAPEVYWFRDGLPLKLFDESMVFAEYGEVVAVRSAGRGVAGNYSCVARNEGGEEAVTYMVRVLEAPPQAKETSRPVSIRAGQPLTLSCPMEGTPRPKVAWIRHPYTELKDTPRIALANDDFTMTINRTQASDSDNYSCILSNKAGTTEIVYSVTIIKPPTIAGNVGTEDHVVLLRRSIVLKCEADGHPLPKIYWLKDTQKLSNTSSNVNQVLGNSLLAVWSAASRDAGQYMCVVENDGGAAHRTYNLAVQVPGKWTAWSQWSLCNATCGVGQQQRSRACQYIDDDDTVYDKTTKPDRIVVDESACKGPALDRRKCQMPPCEEAGSGMWLPWSRWSACSATCGRGTQARTRRCEDKLCSGDNVQIRKCPDLPKCIYENSSDNDVYSKEDGDSMGAYSPEVVFEKEPEIPNSLFTPDVEEFYVAGAGPSKMSYDVNVTSNLDGSDHGACGPGYRPQGDSCHDIDECEIENNQCHLTQVCENTLAGYRCLCSPGYVSLGPGQRCMDVNECSQDTSGCEFACVNTAGGYVCACPAHMRLHADRHHCYTVSSYRRSYDDLDTSEYLSTSVEHPARYRHIHSTYS